MFDVPFRSQPEERSAACAVTHGAVPAALRGTLYRNGPGLLASGSDPLHFLDGHGYVGALTFDGGAPRLRTRHVRTPELVAEQAAGRMLYRRIFTNLPRRWSNLLKLPKGDNANHDIFAFGGRVVASNDRGHYPLDRGTLETLAPERYGDLHRGARLVSPMPRVDPETGRLVGYIVEPGGAKPDRITFFEADDGYRVVSQTEPVALGWSPAIVHDVAFSARYYVVTQATARLRLGPALWGATTLLDCFDWGGAASAELVVVPRRGPGGVRVPIPGSVRAAFHLLNAYDDGDRLVVDLVAYEGVPDFGLFSPSSLATGRRGTTPAPTVLRLVVDPAGARVVERRDVAAAGELPEVRPDRFGRPYRTAWLAASAKGSQAPDPNAFPWFGAIVRLDLETGQTTRWEAGPTTFVSQPVFAPRGDDEDDGFILTWATGAEDGTSEVVVLDARDIAAGPVARIDVALPMPAASHALWVTG